jgi:hypothetical protein
VATKLAALTSSGASGASLKSGGSTVAEVGVAGHQNRRRYLLTTGNVNIAEWACAVDAIVNLPYATLQGEGFFGRAIDDTYSGIAPSAGSGPCRSRIPEQADHWFRSKPITDSGASRSLNGRPAEADGHGRRAGFDAVG